MELILTAAAVIFAEVGVFIAFERCREKRWEELSKGAERPKSSDERFWQNIISYDHKKGGEKE